VGEIGGENSPELSITVGRKRQCLACRKVLQNHGALAYKALDVVKACVSCLGGFCLHPVKARFLSGEAGVINT
jgi:hypothetical protein